jgi:hypothetical protein
MMVVDVQTQPTFTAGRPRPLFEMSTSLLSTSLPSTFDVTADGQHFLMIKQSELELPATHLNIVLNWDQELLRLVPTN